MVEDLDIWRSANVLMKRHGADAELRASLRHDKLMEAGDLKGQITWQQIHAAVVDLLRNRRRDGETLQ